MKQFLRRLTFALLSLALLPAFSGITAIAESPFYTAKQEDTPEWAKQGTFHFIRIDGGRIESLKAERTWWGREFPDSEKAVLTNIYDEHSDKIIGLLKEAGFNWVWVTWSNGWSFKEEAENRKLLRDFIDRCHEEGIRVTTYLSASNMFWESTFIDEPEAVTWLLIQGGKPLNYGGPDNPMRFIADVNNPDWRKYLVKKTRLAVKSGADAVFFDNLIGDTKGIQYLFSMVQSMAQREAAEMNVPKPGLYGNAHLKVDNLEINDRCEIIWNEFGKSTPGVWDEGWYVSNARKIKFITGVKHWWQPHKYENDKYRCGPREKCYPDPAGQKLSIAEAWAFGSSYSRNIEGRFLHDLVMDVPTAQDAWAAISQYNNFINENRELYTDVSPAARVALLYQTGRPGPSGELEEDRLAEMFIKENVMSVTKLVSRLHGGRPLERYKALVVPGPVSALSAEEQAMLLDYAKSGGKIVPLLKDKETPEPAAANASVAKISAPATISGDAVSAVFKTEASPEVLAAVREATGGPLITLENEKYVIANVMKKEGANRFIVHLLNYDHENPEQDVRVTLDLGDYSEGSCEVKLLSPDTGSPALRNVSSSGGTCTFTVGDIEHYSIAVVDTE